MSRSVTDESSDPTEVLFWPPTTTWIEVEPGELVVSKSIFYPEDYSPTKIEQVQITAIFINNGAVEAKLRHNHVGSAMRQRTATSLDLLQNYKPANESAKRLFEALRTSVKLMAMDHG